MSNFNSNFKKDHYPDKDSEIKFSNNPPNKYYFKYYKEITINHLKVSGDLTNFPLLISTYDSDLRTDVQADGDDIAFCNETNWLDHEIELFEQNFNSTHARLVAWIRIPSLLSTNDTKIYIYYGNSTMTSKQNPSGVWNSNFKGVWHLSTTFLDSTANDNDGTNYQSNDVSSKIANGRDYDGIDDYTNVGSGTSLDNLFNGGATISAWINPEGWGGGEYGRILAKASTTSGTDGWVLSVDGEASSAADHHLLFFRGFDGPPYYRGLWYTPEDSISLNQWQHIVVTYDDSSDTNLPSIYVNGILQTPLTPEPSPSGNSVDDSSQSLYIGNYAGGNRAFDGVIDEVRISTGIKSSSWIQTEYNNQYDPESFFTFGIENQLDFVPPIYSDLIESSDPLELGDTEVININVTDPSGVKQVIIEFGGDNHSMNNIHGNTWQYDSWTPNAIGNFSYKIYMEDNSNNWNLTSGSFIVIDTTAPTFSSLLESADPLQFGQNETIQIKVFDTPGSGVNQTLLEYDATNHSMNFISGNTWSWNNWKPTIEGIHSYTIYMKDNQNNWNMTSGNITVITTTAPFIENLTETADPLELGADIIITVDVYDNETKYADTVFIEIENVNYTMTNITEYTYEFTWNGYQVGSFIYKIYANDSGNNWNTLSSSFEVEDNTAPNFAEPTESDDPLELGDTEIIAINCTDLSGINEVRIEFGGGNHSMTHIGGKIWQYSSWMPTIIGNYTYTIWIEDNNNNWNYTHGSIFVMDTTSPSYSGLSESSNPTEIGTSLIISINANDLSGIKRSIIEYQDQNHTMSFESGIWQYNSWMPTKADNYSYRIYIEDNNGNINFTNSITMIFQDTICPIYSNFYIDSNPLELGETLDIRIDASDFSGINQCLIEFENINHSMTNIYGIRWQYDSWTPDKISTCPFSIYIEDMNGKWNITLMNLTVHDTIPPEQPILIISPSGSVSDLIVFDWRDGTDPSNISYYILIIDDESNPETTPGYILKINLTNTGSECSCFELPNNLTLGTYHYFLAQIDGAGHQSDYTSGSFTIISNENNNPIDSNLIFIIIIAIVFMSLVGVSATSIIIRRRIKNKVLPVKKVISIKEILFHIKKISKFPLSIETDKSNKDKESKISKSEDLNKDKELEQKLDEIKKLGEELFEEGAYFEAQKQFNHGMELSLQLGKENQKQLFIELVSGIESLIEAREKRMEQLEREKIQGSSVRIYESYQALIEISKKLRDFDSARMYLSELLQTFQSNKFTLLELHEFQSFLEKKAKSLINENRFKEAAKIYGKCKKISQLLVQLGEEMEKIKINEFKYKKNQCINNINKIKKLEE